MYIYIYIYIHICILLYVSLSISLSLHIYIYIYIYISISRSSRRRSMANLRTTIMDFLGFDSSRIWIPRGGIPRPIGGNFPEILSQRILAGRFLVGRLGVCGLFTLLSRNLFSRKPLTHMSERTDCHQEGQFFISFQGSSGEYATGKYSNKSILWNLSSASNVWLRVHKRWISWGSPFLLCLDACKIRRLRAAVPTRWR